MFEYRFHHDPYVISELSINTEREMTFFFQLELHEIHVLVHFPFFTVSYLGVFGWGMHYHAEM